MKKLKLLLLLLLVCVFAISACGKDGEEKSSGADSTTNAPVNDSTVETIDSSMPSDDTSGDTDSTTNVPVNDSTVESADSSEPSDDTSKDSSQPSDGTTIGNGLTDDNFPEDSANDIF